MDPCSLFSTLPSIFVSFFTQIWLFKNHRNMDFSIHCFGIIQTFLYIYYPNQCFLWKQFVAKSTQSRHQNKQLLCDVGFEKTSLLPGNMTLLINILLQTVSRQTAWLIKREIISPNIPWLYTCSKEAFMCEVPFPHILHEYFMVGAVEQFIALQLVSFTFMIKVYSSFAKGNFNGSSFYGFLRL